jgi:hypothetical protein
MLVSIFTAKQQLAFENLVTEMAAARKISRRLASEILVAELGGGPEKLAA